MLPFLSGWRSMVLPFGVSLKPSRNSWKDFDWLLFMAVTMLSAIGVGAIYSTRQDRPFWFYQLLMVGGCALILFGLARLNYAFWLRWHWFVYGASIALLIAVMVAGSGAGGADRWIGIAGIKIQPSEFAKLSTILTTAAVLHKWPVKQFRQIWLAVAAIAPPWILIFLQPDLGTALIFMAISAGMLYWAGAKASWLLLLISPAIAAVIYGVYVSTNLYWLLWVWLGWAAGMGLLGLWSLPWRWVGAPCFVALNLLSGRLGQIGWNILQPYQRQRLSIFLDPNQDPLGAGYHLIQSRIAISSGGLWGRGLFHGTQTQLAFIPEQHTDFIFAAIGEELGLVGSLVVLTLLWVMCFRLILIAQNAKDNFGSLIAAGAFSMIVFQAVVNIGMTIGLMPITGLPLPFVSYGRSALMTNFLTMGIVESVAKHHRRKTFFT